MKVALLRRLKRLETVQAIEELPPVELQIGYLKKLPAEYTSERHEVTAGRLPDGKYLWEERPGPQSGSDDSNKQIVKVVLVRAKDGRPDYSWPTEGTSMKSIERPNRNEA